MAGEARCEIIEQLVVSIIILHVRCWPQGADMLMVKPGLPYLDVILRLRQVISGFG